MNRLSLYAFRRTAVPTLLFVWAASTYAQMPGASIAVSRGVLAVPGSLLNLDAPIALDATAVRNLSADNKADSDPSISAEPPVNAGSDSLPDAPSAVLPAEESGIASSAALSASAAGQTGNATPNVAPKLTKYIPSGWTAQKITGHDKVLLGLRDLYSPLNFLAMVASAGYEHVLNGEPNYGTDRGAFGERLGAAAIRESTQGIFTDAVFAPLFREDPRYYVEGPSHNFVSRLVYAGTRPLITRTDSGHSTVNGALLAGYAASSALTYTYYPQINKNFRDTASTFGGSLGGAALGFAVSEFSDDLLKAVHLRKK